MIVNIQGYPGSGKTTTIYKLLEKSSGVNCKKYEYVPIRGRQKRPLWITECILNGLKICVLGRYDKNATSNSLDDSCVSLERQICANNEFILKSVRGSIEDLSSNYDVLIFEHGTMLGNWKGILSEGCNPEKWTFAFLDICPFEAEERFKHRSKMSRGYQSHFGDSNFIMQTKDFLSSHGYNTVSLNSSGDRDFSFLKKINACSFVDPVEQTHEFVTESELMLNNVFYLDTVCSIPVHYRVLKGDYVFAKEADGDVFKGRIVNAKTRKVAEVNLKVDSKWFSSNIDLWIGKDLLNFLKSI